MTPSNDTTTDTRSYTVLEINTPIVITLIDASVFKADRYRLSTQFVTASGRWGGGESGKRTVMIPMSSIMTIDLTAKEVPENDVPQEHKESVRMQIQQL